MSEDVRPSTRRYDLDNLDQLAEELLRINASWLESLATPTREDFGESIVRHLVNILDAHGRWYLLGVNDESSLQAYVTDLRTIGDAVLDNAIDPHYLRSLYADGEVHAPGPLPVEMLQTAALQYESRYAFWSAEALRILRQLRTAGVPPYSVPLPSSALSILGGEPVRVFKSPLFTQISAAGSAKSWADVEITFVREDLIRIHVGNHVETKDAIQMGLADGRSPERKKYKSAWHIMRIMSQADGVLHDGHIQGKKWPTIYKHVTSLRERLQQFFGIAEDPLPYTNEGYKAAFKINRSPDFAADPAELDNDEARINLFNDHRSKMGVDKYGP